MTEKAFLKSLSVSGCNAAADCRGVESVDFNTFSISLHTSWGLFYLRNGLCCLLHLYLVCSHDASHNQGACAPCIACIIPIQDTQRPQISHHLHIISYIAYLQFGPSWAAVVLQFSPPCPVIHQTGCDPCGRTNACLLASRWFRRQVDLDEPSDFHPVTEVGWCRGRLRNRRVRFAQCNDHRSGVNWLAAGDRYPAPNIHTLTLMEQDLLLQGKLLSSSW